VEKWKAHSGSHFSTLFAEAGKNPCLAWVAGLLDGSPNVLTLGNGVQQTITKNSRLQVQSLSVTATSGPMSGATLLSHTYCYVGCTTGGAANNGNIWGITDTLKAANTQGFTYDSLNRIGNFSLNGTLNQKYDIDSFGNMSLDAGGTPVTSFDPATNRISNLPCAPSLAPLPSYDAAGNQMCSTDANGAVSHYAYDADGKIGQIALLGYESSPFVSYVYNPIGTRVRKNNAGGTYTEYVDFGGQPMAEKDQAGNWTDYIYADGRKIAREASASSIWMHGANSDPVEARVELSLAHSIAISAGDHLNFIQYQQASGGSVAGMNLIFDNGWQLNGSCGSCAGQPAAAVDQNSVAVDKWNANYATNYRSVDLSNFAGHSVSGAEILKDISAPGGSWDILISFISVTHADGSVDTIYNSTDPIGLNMPAEPNLSNNWVSYNGVPGPNTRYYLDDHLGTAQMELSPGGWPVWQGQFTPFGQEIVNGAPLLPGQADGSSMHYKFTGKERDAESGLDYFGARYYASNMGRWVSPDWSAKEEPVPYANLDDPQTLNLYGYVRNNPLSKADPDGHCPWCIGMAIGVVAEIGIDLYTHQDITARKIIGAAVGGAIAGASGGLGLEEGIAVRAAIASGGSIIGGITERAIKTGSLAAATKDPKAIVRDAAVGAVGSVAENGVRAAVGSTEKAAIQNLKGQATNTANRAAKIEGRIVRNTEKLAAKQEAAGTKANVLSGVVDKIHDRCGTGTCN